MGRMTLAENEIRQVGFAYDARARVFQPDRNGSLNSFFMTEDKAAMFAKNIAQ